MRDENIRIRAAAPEDAVQLLAIYTPYVERTAITFEYDVPTLEEFRRRIARTLQRYPYLTAERGGELLGYAYLDRAFTRAAYQWAADVSVYLRPEARRQWLGRRFYALLERMATERKLDSLEIRTLPQLAAEILAAPRPRPIANPVERAIRSVRGEPVSFDEAGEMLCQMLAE